MLREEGKDRKRDLGIDIKEQNCGQGYGARGTIDRIILKQSPKVDAVTGASSSSRCIMIAVDQALRNATR